MLTLYGSSKSRAARALVALEELGLRYRHAPLDPRARPQDRITMDAINPNGHVPVLDDDGLIVWESMAINLYLADKVGGPLWPTRPADRAATYQWSFWAQTEIDRADWNRARRGGDEALIASDRRDLVKALSVLDRALEGRTWLLGEAFTIVDVNVATTLGQPNENGLIGWQKLDPAADGLPALAAWLARCAARPSYLAVRDMR
ncbi:MAG: glutathione S-transferase family protein [Phenylobacterium sp.]|uniref:glutathione S-transferase family protein n=1 Tax=Phenylobacterium sp. TaxID=1871053 RepID=UPI002735A3EE|nr:glutathione S-transferase family protein [Phenylobacterium sp.]MDP3746920.1 glutathione S-transferase family protein [Phenylobacterium sp.]